MAKEKEGTPVDLREKTTVIATNGHPYIKKDEEISVHPNLAKDLLKKGWAVEKGESTTVDDHHKLTVGGLVPGKATTGKGKKAAEEQA